MYQSGRVGDEAKKHKSPAKSGRVGITDLYIYIYYIFTSLDVKEVCSSKTPKNNNYS